MTYVEGVHIGGFRAPLKPEDVEVAHYRVLILVTCGRNKGEY